MDINNTYGLKELQISELNILKMFMKTCIENDWRYYALGGTLLGAVRHKGFIPWDDDIDIGMPRKDFEQMLTLFQNHPPKGFHLQAFQLTKDYVKYVPRIIDDTITLKFNATISEQNSHPWIDIFPLDGMPDNHFFRKIHSLQLLAARLKVNYASFSKNVDIKKKHRPFHERILIWIGFHFPVEKMINHQKALFSLDKLLKKYDFDSSDYIINFMGAYKFKEMFPREKYLKIQEYLFEDILIPGPFDYDHVLTQLYGNYMAVPSKDNRNHHNICIENK